MYKWIEVAEAVLNAINRKICKRTKISVLFSLQTGFLCKNKLGNDSTLMIEIPDNLAMKSLAMPLSTMLLGTAGFSAPREGRELFSSL